MTGKRKDEKNFENIWKIYLKSFYLCIRFPEKADIKEAIFEEIYKQYK